MDTLALQEMKRTKIKIIMNIILYVLCTFYVVLGIMAFVTFLNAKISVPGLKIEADYRIGPKIFLGIVIGSFAIIPIFSYKYPKLSMILSFVNIAMLYLAILVIENDMDESFRKYIADNQIVIDTQFYFIKGNDTWIFAHNILMSLLAYSGILTLHYIAYVIINHKIEEFLWYKMVVMSSGS